MYFLFSNKANIRDLFLELANLNLFILFLEMSSPNIRITLDENPNQHHAHHDHGRIPKKLR